MSRYQNTEHYDFFFWNIIEDFDKLPDFNDKMELVSRLIDRMDMEPSFELQTGHAHWVETRDLAGNRYINCSHCDYLFWLEDESANEAEFYYCPRCGYIMDEPYRMAEEG